MTLSCANNKGVYWCGDHPCINKKEKEAYFKKNMVVEIRKYNKLDQKKKSEIDKITKQARINEKKRIKEEKNLAKQIRLEEKKRLKEEKRAAKEENKKLKKEKKKFKKDKKSKKQNTTESKIVATSSNNVVIDINSSEFDDLVEKITKKNKTKPYPSLSDIGN